MARDFKFKVTILSFSHKVFGYGHHPAVGAEKAAEPVGDVIALVVCRERHFVYRNPHRFFLQEWHANKSLPGSIVAVGENDAVFMELRRDTGQFWLASLRDERAIAVDHHESAVVA